MRRIWTALAALVWLATVLLLWNAGAGAVNLCTLTGNLTLIDGQAGANAQVFFDTVSTQSFGGTVIPPSSFSVFTDAQGNLPPGVTLPQGAIVQVTVGTSQPVQIQIPLAATADLATLILANNDPPSVVSAVAIGAGGDYGLTVTNPSTGAIGTAVLQPGKVTSIQGSGFSAATPVDAQVPIFSSGANRWQPESIVGDATIGDDGSLSVNGIAAGGNINGKSTGGPFSISDYNVNNEFNPMQYGARLDARRVGDMAVTNGSTTVSSSSANFTPADVGKLIVIWTAGSGASFRTFTGTITAVAAPTAVLSAPYGGATQSGATAFIGTDDGAAVNAALQAVGLNNSGVVKVPGGVIMTTTTLAINGRSEEFGGQGLGANLNINASGTLIVWAGGNQPVIQITDSYGARVHDFAIMGSDQASTMPSACINFLNHVTGNLTGHPNSFNVVSNIYCGDVSELSLPGSGGGNPTVTAGIMIGDASGTQDDRNIIENVTVKHGIYGIQFGQNQAVEWSVRNLHCNRDGICIDAHVGFSQVEFTEIEDLQSALSFFIGQAGYVSVRNYADETDGPTTIAPPWSANFAYPKNFVIKDPNGNFELVGLFGGSSAGLVPVFATQSTNFGVTTISRTSNVVTVTTSSTHDFQIGQLVAIVNVTDSSFNGAFTITGVPAANQFSYIQTAADASSSGGTAYHATADNTVVWLNTGTATAFSQLVLFAGSGGNAGGTLAITSSVWDANNQSPYNGDYIAGSGADFTFIGEDFKVINSNLAPPGPGTVPMVDLSAPGIGSRTFMCSGCRGITKPNLNVTVSNSDNRQITYIDMQRLAGPDGSAGSAGIGEYFINALINGDPAGVDDFRYDFPGKVRELGGPLTVMQLANPTLPPFQLSCSDGGTPPNNTYRYKYTALSGSGETLATSIEAPVNCAGNAGVSGVSIIGRVYPILGADNYNVYRTAANGAPGTEKLALTLPANSTQVGPLSSNSFRDTTPDGSLGSVPPNLNTTGNATVGGVLTAGAAAAAGALPGDLSAAQAAGKGMLWLGSSGTQSLDFGVTNAGAFTLLGGGLVTPAISLSGAGQLFMGSTTVASLPACNASNKLSWLVVTNHNAACAYGAAPAGGATNVCPVFCDGSAWKIH